MQHSPGVFKSVAKLFLGRGVRPSYGQFGEDAIVQAMLKSKKRGFYVDVGAFHPTLYSNTYGLYRSGWRGLVIDPNDGLRRIFKLIRPRDTFVVAAVGSTEAMLTYHRFADASYNTFDTQEAATRVRERGLVEESSREVRVELLRNILHANGVTAIDFMNIDVEGMDVAVLEGHDWAIRPRVIAIEDDSFDVVRASDSAVWRFLSEKGYILAGLAGQTLVFRDTKPGVDK